MIQEIIAGLDIHTDNAKRFFGNIKYRQEAKVLSFRYLYGGSAYAFYMDNNMPSFSLSKWEGIVQELKEKYSGLTEWQQKIYREVCQTGRLINPSGRILTFDRHQKKDGSYEYSFPQVVNAPVQSLATADIVPLAMCVAMNRLQGVPDWKLVMQVHDSLIFDCATKSVDAIARTCYNVFNELPSLIEQFFGFRFNVPLTGEIKVGPTWAACKDYPLC